ncbi:MAG: glycoside hydrolase family 88 protein [Clostridia bacterium]|nr:glycoside hydrolase family 88 protein [Clostridia bacterium]
MDTRIEAFIRQYLTGYTPYKTYWNYEDGCVLVGCADLFAATGEAIYKDFVLSYLDKLITPDGKITNYPADKYNIDSTNCGKALFFAYDQTGDERYKKAAAYLTERLKTHPRCACGNFWHKEIYPEQIWLDGLYMAQPFRVEYDMRFGGKKDAADVVKQFQNVRAYLYDDQKKLYYHACDMMKQQPWANKETGKSPNFWLRSMGWYLMALIDCIDKMDEMLYEHLRALIDLFREAISGIVQYADPATGLYYQVIDRADVEGNYLETSGSAMVIYSVLKGVRLGLLDEEKYLPNARKAFENLSGEKLRQDDQGLWHLNGICAVAGLGPGEKRDGSVAYYLSEPIVADDAKGVGPYLMALSEFLRAKA